MIKIQIKYNNKVFQLKGIKFYEKIPFKLLMQI